MEIGGLVEQRVVGPEAGIVAHPELGGMEVAQNGGQAAHVVGVGVGEGDRVEVANAARPQNLGDDLLADVEVLRGLVRAAAKAAAIDQQGFAVGGDQQQGVALADVDGFHQQCVARVIDGARHDGGKGGEQQSGPGERRVPAAPAWMRPWWASTMAAASSAQKATDCQSSGAGMRKSPRAIEPKRCTSPMPKWSTSATSMAGTTAAAGHRASASRVTSAAGISTSKQRQDEDIHRQGEDGDAVEVDGHGQGHGQLHHAGDDQQLDDAEAESARPREKRARR